MEKCISQKETHNTFACHTLCSHRWTNMDLHGRDCLCMRLCFPSQHRCIRRRPKESMKTCTSTQQSMHREQKPLAMKSRFMSCKHTGMRKRCFSAGWARFYAAGASLPASSLSAEDASSGKSSKLYSILLGQAPWSAKPTCTSCQFWPAPSHSQARIANIYWMCLSGVVPKDGSLTVNTLWYQISLAAPFLPQWAFWNHITFHHVLVTTLGECDATCFIQNMPMPKEICLSSFTSACSPKSEPAKRDMYHCPASLIWTAHVCRVLMRCVRPAQ